MWYLVVLFIINGEATIQDGWHPMPTESEEACGKLKQTTTDYLNSIDLRYEFVVSCNEKEQSNGKTINIQTEGRSEDSSS
jgi:hypothetical protein